MNPKGAVLPKKKDEGIQICMCACLALCAKLHHIICFIITKSALHISKSSLQKSNF